MPGLAIKFLVSYIMSHSEQLYCRTPNALPLLSILLQRTALHCILPSPTLEYKLFKRAHRLTAQLVFISWAWAACVYILNTPNLGSPIGAFKAELKLSPKTVRVSTGSMTPSSHNLQHQQKEWSVVNMLGLYWGQPFSLNREVKYDNSEVKHDVYGKRQTAKLKLFLSLISCV